MVFISTRQKLTLSSEEITFLNDVFSNSKNSRKQIRAKILLHYAQDSYSITKIANLCSASRQLVTRVVDNALLSGVQSAISERDRSGRPKLSKNKK